MLAVSEREARASGENAALALRQRLRLGLDCADLEAIAEQRQVIIIRHDFGAGEDDPDGVYTWDGEVGLIVVNLKKLPQRQRFTIAHELGHHELHRFRGEGPIVDLDVYATIGPDGVKDPDEVSANSFAAHLLLPAAAIESIVTTRRNGEITEKDIVELVRHYRVSWEMACYRLHNEDFIRGADRDRLLNMPRKATLAAHEIHDDHYLDHGPPLPAQLQIAAAQLWADWVITDERLAEILETTTGAALARMDEWEIRRAPLAEVEADRAAEQIAAAGVDMAAVLDDLEFEFDDEDQEAPGSG